MFASAGFDRASLKQIAEDAGLTRNAIANYYTSKGELYAAALESVQSAVVDAILAHARATEGPIHTRVMAVFSSAAGFSETDPTFVRFFVTSTADAIYHPDLREQALRPIASVQSFVQGLLEDARRRDEIPDDLDAEAITQVLMDLIWGLAMDIGFYSDPARVPRTLDSIERVLRTVLGTAATVDAVAATPEPPTPCGGPPEAGQSSTRSKRSGTWSG